MTKETRLDKNTQKFLDGQKKRIQKENKPGSIIISGPPGRGKTTLAVDIADYYEDNKIIFDEQIANGYDDFMKKFPNAIKKKYGVFIYDEGGDLSKRRAMSSLNYNVLRIYDLFRGYKIFLIHIIQNFNMLDRALLDTEVPRALFYIKGRNSQRALFNAYDLAKMYYIKYYMSNPRLIIKNKAFHYVIPNYSNSFKDLDPERSKDLYKFSIKAKTELLKALRPKDQMPEATLDEEMLKRITARPKKEESLIPGITFRRVQ